MIEGTVVESGNRGWFSVRPVVARVIVGDIHFLGNLDSLSLWLMFSPLGGACSLVYQRPAEFAALHGSDAPFPRVAVGNYETSQYFRGSGFPLFGRHPPVSG